MYILYGGGFTRAHLCEMVFRELAVPYEVRDVDTVRQENRSPEFLKVNPAGWVPALITPQGEILWETAAINLYLAERYGQGALAPGVDDPQRGRFLSGLFYLTDELEPALKRYFYPHRYVVRPDNIAGARRLASEAVSTCLAVIEGRLAAGGPFHLGARYSLVDLTLAYWTGSLLDQTIAAEFPAIQACVAGVRARASMREMFVDLDRRTDAYFTLDAQDV